MSVSCSLRARGRVDGQPPPGVPLRSSATLAAIVACVVLRCVRVAPEEALVERHELGPVLSEMLEEVLARPGRRWTTLAQTCVAPGVARRPDDLARAAPAGRRSRAGRARPRPRRRCPRSVARSSARRRWRGGAVPGSVRRQTSSSRVGTEKRDADLRACRRIGEHVDVADDQRPARDDRERVRRGRQHLAGKRASAGIAPRRAGTGSVAVPSATDSPCQVRRASSVRSTSATLTLTRIERPYASPDGRSARRSYART